MSRPVNDLARSLLPSTERALSPDAPPQNARPAHVIPMPLPDENWPLRDKQVLRRAPVCADVIPINVMEQVLRYSHDNLSLAKQMIEFPPLERVKNAPFLKDCIGITFKQPAIVIPEHVLSLMASMLDLLQASDHYTVVFHDIYAAFLQNIKKHRSDMRILRLRQASGPLGFLFAIADYACFLWWVCDRCIFNQNGCALNPFVTATCFFIVFQLVALAAIFHGAVYWKMSDPTLVLHAPPPRPLSKEVILKVHDWMTSNLRVDKLAPFPRDEPWGVALPTGDAPIVPASP